MKEKQAIDSIYSIPEMIFGHMKLLKRLGIILSINPSNVDEM